MNRETRGGNLNIVDENIARLKDLFSEAFKEGKIDFEVLRDILGDAVETGEERYNSTWNGKSAARRIAQTLSTGTLRPCREESKNWESTQNLFI